MKSSDAREWFRARVGELDLEKGPPAPILLGRHLLEIGMNPGPGLGAVLKAVYDQQLDGRITTVEEALDVARMLQSTSSEIA